MGLGEARDSSKFVPFWESNGLIEISRRLAAEQRAREGRGGPEGPEGVGSGQHAAVPATRTAKPVVAERPTVRDGGNARPRGETGDPASSRGRTSTSDVSETSETSNEGRAGMRSATTSSTSTSGTRMEEEGFGGEEQRRPDGPMPTKTTTFGLLEFGLILAGSGDDEGSSRGKTALELEESAVRERVDVTAMTDAVLRLLTDVPRPG